MPLLGSPHWLTLCSPNSFQQTTKPSRARIQDRTNPASSSRLRPLDATSRSTILTPTTQSCQIPKPLQALLRRLQISSWSSWTFRAPSQRTCQPLLQPRQPAGSGPPPPRSSSVTWISRRTTTWCRPPSSKSTWRLRSTGLFSASTWTTWRAWSHCHGTCR